MASLVGSFWHAVVCTYEKWCKEGQPVNQHQGWEQWLDHLVWSHRKATVAIIERHQNTAHHSFAAYGAVQLQAGQDAHDGPCPLPKVSTMGLWASELDCGAMEEGCLVSFSFRSGGWLCVCATFTWGRDGSRMHYGKKVAEAVLCSEQCSAGKPVDITLICITYLEIVVDT